MTQLKIKIVAEPENAYSDLSNIGRKGYNSAGCVTNIQYSGSGYSENIGLLWNSQYQLTEVKTNGTAVERNGFDPLGRRVWNWNGTETNYFVYDGQQIIADVDSTGGLRRAYVWGPGIDNLLAMTVYTGATVKTYFALTDHLRSVHAMADETGTIVESYRFDAWGRVLGVYNGSGQPISESAIGNRFLWSGKQYSWRTGFYDNRARVYDPITGRFLSKDPRGITGGLNEYVYANNNPVNFIDPDGAMPRWFENALNSYSYSTWGRQCGSISDAFGAGVAGYWGWFTMNNDLSQAAGQLLQQSANNSGWAVLDEECAGKGAKGAYIAVLGVTTLDVGLLVAYGGIAEIGSKAFSNAAWNKLGLEGMTEFQKGLWLIKNQGLLSALAPTGTGLGLGFGSGAISQGPTAAAVILGL